MSLDAFLLGFTATINITLGLFVLLRNPKSPISQSFSAISVSITAWAISNYLADNATRIEINSIGNQLAYVFGYLSVVSMLVFSYAMLGSKFEINKKSIVDTLFISFGAIFSGSHLSAGTVERVDSELEFTLGPLINVWSIIMFGMLFLVARNFIRLFRSGNRVVRYQAIIIMTGMLFTVVLAMLTNVIIPIISASLDGTPNFDTAKFGPFLTVILVSAITFAILKHQLFDIKWLVARSAAYVLSIISLALLIGGLVFVLINEYIFHDSIQLPQVLLTGIIALVFGLLFNKIRSFFDSLTDRIFHRKKLKLNQVIGRFAELLVENSDYKSIDKSAIKYLNDVFQPVATSILIYNRKDKNPAYIGTHEVNAISDTDVDLIRKVKKSLINLDENDDHDMEFIKDEICLIVPVFNKNRLQAHLILGKKRNGDIYRKVDLDIIKACAYNLSIAIDNAEKYEEIKSFNQDLQIEIDKATQSLKINNAKLKALSASKDDFISAASHQLKPQIGAVSNFLEILVIDKQLSEKQKTELINKATVSINRISRLVTDILEKALDKDKPIVPSKKPTDLKSIVKRVVSQKNAIFRSKNIKTKVFTSKPRKVSVDELLITECIDNLITNGYQYSPSNSKLDIKLEFGDKEFKFTAVDAGIGIEEADVGRVLNKFYRSETAKKLRPDGTGVGLYITREYVEAHGGKMVISPNKTKGSTFGFKIPV